MGTLGQGYSEGTEEGRVRAQGMFHTFGTICHVYLQT